jgi:hypothetical protein
MLTRGCDKRGGGGTFAKNQVVFRKSHYQAPTLIYGRTGKRTAHEIITCDGSET